MPSNLLSSIDIPVAVTKSEVRAISGGGIGQRFEAGHVFQHAYEICLSVHPGLGKDRLHLRTYGGKRGAVRLRDHLHGMTGAQRDSHTCLGGR